MSIADDNGEVVQSCYYSVFGEPSVDGSFYNDDNEGSRRGSEDRE